MKSPATPILSLSTSLSSSSFVQIGEGSYSPGDVYIESLLPRVITKNRVPQPQKLKQNSNNNYKQPQSSISSDGRSLQDDDDDDANVVVIPFADHFVVQQAQQECCSLLNGNSVVVVEDEDVKEEVVEVLGPEAELLFRTRNIFRYLVLFVKNLDQFFEFALEVLDDKQKYRYLKVTNTKSLARVEDSTVQLPLAFGGSPGGWRYLCMDLQRLTMQAFGTKHVTTTQVRIGGSCRLLRVFFQDELYSDVDLPAHLTFLG